MSTPSAAVAATAELPVTSSPLPQAHALWQYFATSPPAGTTIHPALQLSSSPTTGLGLSVSSIIQPHTVLLRLPRSCHLRPDSNADIAASLPADDPFLSLCLTLLHERANNTSDSPHQAHLNALPTHFDLPLTWSASQLTYLSATSLALRPPIADLATDWTLHIQPYLTAHPTYPRIQPSDYQWAVCCVLSRGFRDRDGRACMVPLLDYCNTLVATSGGGGGGSGTRASCYIGWTETGDAVLLSGGDGLAAGDEVTIMYGEERGNGSLLQRYGFVVDGNEEDTCDVDVQQLATIVREMGATPLRSAKHRKLDKPAQQQETKQDRNEQAVAEEKWEERDEAEEGDEEEDDGIDEFIDQLPEEFISLTMPPSYPSPAASLPLPLRLQKLVAALLSYYPTDQLVSHTDCKPFTLSLPLRLDGELRQGTAEKAEVGGEVGQQQETSDWVTSEELRLGMDEELDVLQVLWVALNERLALLSEAMGGSSEKEVQAESEEDGRRRRMAEVLKASERRIVAAHNDNVKRRIAYLLESLQDEDAGEDGEDDDESDEQEEEEAYNGEVTTTVPVPQSKRAVNGKRRR